MVLSSPTCEFVVNRLSWMKCMTMYQWQLSNMDRTWHWQENICCDTGTLSPQGQLPKQQWIYEFQTNISDM